MAGAGRKVWVADEILAADDLQDYIQDQVVFVFDSAGARTSGILSPSEGMVSYLKDTNLLYVYDGTSWVEVAPDVGTPGTYTKVTTDFKGRVTSGTTLAATDIPNLDASKTTSGAFNADRIPTLSTSKISGLDGALNSKLNLSGGTLTGTLATNSLITSSTQIFTSNEFRTTGSVWANGDVRGGTISGDNSIACSGTYNQTNAPARAMFVNSSGVYGIGSSSVRFKKNIVNVDVDVDVLRKILVRNFEYKAEFGGDGTVDVGVIAEELQELGLDEFVYLNDDGEAQAVAYEKLGLMGLVLAQNLADRVDALEARLEKLESR